MRSQMAKIGPSRSTSGPLYFRGFSGWVQLILKQIVVVKGEKCHD